ncbi:MAG TPA: GMC family oxidoreductase [Longimicrobiales bacterium]
MVIESDVLIIGSGIAAAMVAEKLADEREARIVVVEAGDHAAPLEERPARRARYVAYGENPWPNDHVDGLAVDGMQSRTMQVGGQAMQWGGVTPRFSPEDFRLHSLYGVGEDWPITYEDLDPFYQEAEERIGVAGVQGPPELDPRSKPYPLPPLPLTHNLEQLRRWGERAGIPLWSQPSAKASQPYRGRPACCRNDTCAPICPIGAKYSPDFTWRALVEAGRVELIPRTMVRRLVLEPNSQRVSHAIAVSRDRPDEPIEFHARAFVLAGGYLWTPHLLLLSAEPRFPAGLANGSGLVGRYIAGHRSVHAFIELPLRLYPGMNMQHGLFSTKFMRPGELERYMRHDLRVWESTFGREPRLRGEDGKVLLGDEVLADWRRRTATGVAHVRAYYDVLPAPESRLSLDTARATPWGDPLPRLHLRDAPASRALRAHTEQSIRTLFERMARAGEGRVLMTRVDEFRDHPCGGCRMGVDPARSVCDPWGRTHDHENLFIAGAPACVTAGCTDGTLTFCALALRTAAELGKEFPPRAA